MKTFRELYNFMQTADVDDFGHLKLSDIWSLHIYSNKRQVNICQYHDSLMNFVFLPEENVVAIYKCNTPGICEYGQPFHQNMDAIISVHNEEYFEFMCSAHYGQEIHEVLRDIIL